MGREPTTARRSSVGERSTVTRLVSEQSIDSDKEWRREDFGLRCLGMKCLGFKDAADRTGSSAESETWPALCVPTLAACGDVGRSFFRLKSVWQGGGKLERLSRLRVRDVDS